MTLRGGSRRNSNILSYHDQPMMTQAILRRDADAVKNLVLTCDINATDVEKRSFLHLACYVGCKVIVESLIAHGANVNMRDRLGLTPMHRCCRNNHDEVLKVLLKCDNVDINCKSKDGTTLLHVCAANNAFESAELFISKVSIDAKDAHGATPLHHAAFNSHNDLLNLLIDSGADVNATDNEMRTALHFAAFIDDTKAIGMLVDAGAAVNAVDKKMMTPLHFAAAKGQLSAVATLLEQKASVNEIDEWGNTPLHLAAFFGHEDVIGELLASGESLVNAPNLVGLTPLHFAVISQDGKPAVKMLIRQKNSIGLVVDAKDRNGRTPLHWAEECKNSSVMDLILRSVES